MKLTNKEAAKKLNVSYGLFYLIIARSEFAKYRCQVEQIVYKKKKGLITKYIQTVSGIQYNDNLVNDFKKFMKQKGY